MSLRLRRLIYLIFILFFLVFAPLIILHTAGYRYNWQKSKIEEVGVLFLDVKPADSRLYLNNILLLAERPLRLTNLLPNYYSIRAEKDGYFSWQKNLEVKSRLGTLVYNIALFKNQLPQLLVSGKISAFSQLPEEKKFVYLADDEVWLRKSGEEAKPIFRLSSGWPGADYQLSWSPNEQFLLVKEISGQKNRFIVLDTSNVGENINLREITGLNFPDLNWSPTEDYLLYGLTAGELYKINLNRQKMEKIAEGVKNFGWLENNLYLIQNKKDGSVVFKYNSLGLAAISAGLKEIASLPFGEYRLAGGRHNYLAAIDVSRNNIFLIDVKNNHEPLLLLKGKEIIWGQGAKNDYLNYYNDGEWWIFDPKTKKSQMMGRYSRDLRKVLPLLDASYFIFLLNNTLYLTELDDRDQRNIYKLFEGQEISDVWLDARGENIYFLDKIGKERGLFQLEIQ